MTENSARFNGRVAQYERYRMRYPAEAVLEHLRKWCGLTAEWTVADVGAGTGMLAEVFLQNENCVVAVEPNSEMRVACEHLREQWPKLRVLDGTAEHTGLESSSVNLVAAGRAFHWFDQVKAMAEFRRILKPGGKVALVSAGRAKDGSEQVTEYERLLVEYGTDYAYIRGGYRVHERLDEFFEPQSLKQAEIHGEERLSLEELIGQTMSLSVAPLEDDPRHEAMMHALREFFERYNHDGLLRVPTRCWISCGKPKDAAKEISQTD